MIIIFSHGRGQATELAAAKSPREADFAKGCLQPHRNLSPLHLSPHSAQAKLIFPGLHTVLLLIFSSVLGSYQFAWRSSWCLAEVLQKCLQPHQSRPQIILPCHTEIWDFVLGQLNAAVTSPGKDKMMLNGWDLSFFIFFLLFFFLSSFVVLYWIAFVE